VLRKEPDEVEIWRTTAKVVLTCARAWSVPPNGQNAVHLPASPKCHVSFSHVVVNAGHRTKGRFLESGSQFPRVVDRVSQHEESIDVPDVVFEVAEFNQTANEKGTRRCVVRQPRLVEQHSPPELAVLAQKFAHFHTVERVEPRPSNQFELDVLDRRIAEREIGIHGHLMG